MDMQNKQFDDPLTLEPEIDLPIYKPSTVFGRVLRVTMFIIAPIALLAGGVAYKTYMDNNKVPVVADVKPEKSATVETLTASFQNIRPTIRIYGQTVAGKQLNLRANVGGEVLQISPNFKSGALVNKGELLFSVDPFNYEGALLNAQSNYDETITNVDELKIRSKSEEFNLETAKEQLVSAQTDYDSAVILRKLGTITNKALNDKQLQLTQRKQSVDISQNNLQAQLSQMKRLQTGLKNLQWSIDKAKKDLRNTKIYAPFDAYVQGANMQIGQLTGTNEQVATLIDRSKMDIVFTLSDGVYGRILGQDGTLIGREVKLIWNAGSVSQEFTATIDRVAAQITASSGGVELYAQINSLKNVATLRVGTFMTVEIPDVEYINVLKIPEHVIYDGDVLYVLENKLVVVKDKKEKDSQKDNQKEDTILASNEEQDTATKEMDEVVAEPKYENRLSPREIKVVGYDGTFTLVVNKGSDNSIQNGDPILKTRLSTAGPSILVITLKEAELNRLERLKKIEEKKAEAKAKEEESNAESKNADNSTQKAGE